MRDALRAGAPCDVFIATDAMIDVAAGERRAATPARGAAIGRVQTGDRRARRRAARRRSATPQALKAALLAAERDLLSRRDALDRRRHVATVLARLGIRDAVASRLRMFPNGATAMRELRRRRRRAPIGCTQVTEIRYTPGLALVGALPAPFALATVYTRGASRAQRATTTSRARFIELLAGDASAALRRAGGFDELRRRRRLVQRAVAAADAEAAGAGRARARPR